MDRDKNEAIRQSDEDVVETSTWEGDKKPRIKTALEDPKDTQDWESSKKKESED